MKDLLAFLNKAGIEDAESKVDILEKYMEEILTLNESINLTAIKERDQFIQKHYIDSLTCCMSPEFLNGKKVIDIGTGGGFPGIPLAVAFPDKEFVLMDSLAKRIKIIDRLCQELGITNVTAIHARAEELARNKSYREQFDVCVSRAVANMSTLAEYCIPFVKKGGWFISYKGDDCYEEVDEAAKALKLLGGKLDRIDELDMFDLPFEHKLVFINKIKETPKAYPRKAGTPAKTPIK